MCRILVVLLLVPRAMSSIYFLSSGIRRYNATCDRPLSMPGLGLGRSSEGIVHAVVVIVTL